MMKRLLFVASPFIDNRAYSAGRGFDAGAVYEGVNKLQNEKSDVPSSAESRGVAHLLMGAGVVLL